MLHLTNQSRILLAINPVDFRKGLDSLIALCRQQLYCDARSGVNFVFINRSRTMIRVLSYDVNGYWLATKRLSKGRYHQWPKGSVDNKINLPAATLKQILSQPVVFKD